jgi:hypothetical protein
MVVPTSCHAYLSLYSGSTSATYTFELFSTTAVGGTATQLGSTCTTDSGNPSCTINGGTLNAGELIYFTGTSTAYPALFSCQ